MHTANDFAPPAPGAFTVLTLGFDEPYAGLRDLPASSPQLRALLPLTPPEQLRPGESTPLKLLPFCTLIRNEVDHEPTALRPRSLPGGHLRGRRHRRA